MTPLPALFVSHGAPTFAMEPGRAGPLLRALSLRLPRPRAILVVSPHWMTRDVQVSASPWPATIHDFGGFPEALYHLRYPAPGAPEVAMEVARHLESAGFTSALDIRRGLDHGAWVPLRYLYPDADIPVLQVSQPALHGPAQFLAFGQALAGLRQQGILVVGSGSITHNLFDFRHGQADPARYAIDFVAWVAERMAAGDLDSLLAYRRLAPLAERAHPTDEHLMPLFVAMGAAGNDWTNLRRIDAGITDGVLGMDAYVFGVAPTLLATNKTAHASQSEAVA